LDIQREPREPVAEQAEGAMARQRIGKPISSYLDHPGARSWSPTLGCFGAALTLLIPLLLLVIGWSLRGLPNLPSPQTRPGSVPEAHWESLASLATPRADFAAVAVDGRLWALGGITSDGGTRLNTTEAYDPSSNTWIPGPTLQVARSAFSAATVGQLIYIFGGATTEQTSTTTVQVLDTTTGQWRDLAALPTPLANAALAQLGGTIYLVGGEANGTAVGTVYAYTPASNSWRTLAALPAARTDLAVAPLEGKLYAIGGMVNGAASATVDVYDPATNGWTTGAPLLAPMANFGAVALDGRLYAVSQLSHEMLDPRVNRWVEAEAMPTPREADGVVALNGSIYSIGGHGDGTRQSTALVEAYVPGAATDPDNFQLFGINRGGSIAVILGLFVTVGLIWGTIVSNRRRPSPGSRNPHPFNERPSDGNAPR
jgi:N-acetylneuraminic acid mutarotase